MHGLKKPADPMLVGLLFFLLSFSACEETHNQPEHERLYVIASVLNLREQPTTQAHVVKRLERGQELIVLDRDAIWIHVQVDDETRGWVHGNYVGDPSAVRAALQQDLAQRSPTPRPRRDRTSTPETRTAPEFSIDAMLSGMPDDMVLEELDPIENQQRFMGAAAGGQIVVSFWGSETEVQRADIMVSVVDVPEENLQRNAAWVLQFVQNAVPHWQRDTAWVANFLKELSSKDVGEGGFDTREKIVRFQFVKPLGSIRITIEKV